MPQAHRYIEIAVYSILNFAPYIIIALYPFRYSFRFSKRTTYLLACAVTVVQVFIGLWSGLWNGNGGLLSALSTVVYAGFYFSAVKAHFGKPLFTLLMLSNIANFVVISSKCIEGVFSPELALQDYRWSFSLAMLFVELAVLTPLFLYIFHTYSNVLEKDVAKPTWRFLWMIPATFYVVWFYHLYNNGMSALETALVPANTVFLLIINLGALVVYHVVVRHIGVISENLELSEQNHALAMQKLQYDNLQDRIAEARRVKHDLRHNVLMIQSLLEDQRYEEALEYLKWYELSMPDDRTIQFCKHYATNALLLYFAQQAKNDHIDFSVAVDVPENLSVSDNAISVVLGNLLENAVEANKNVDEDKRSIAIKSICEGGTILFKIRNTYAGRLKQDKNGLYLSTKDSGRGIGLASVRNIIEQNGGMMEVAHDETYVTVTVMLMLQEKSM